MKKWKEVIILIKIMNLLINSSAISGAESNKKMQTLAENLFGQCTRRIRNISGQQYHTAYRLIKETRHLDMQVIPFVS